MAIKTKIIVRDNALAGGGKVASATIVDLQEMDFDAFCEYLAQDSTVGAADVAAVMKQLEKKLPLILGMGTKVQISAEGMVVKPTVSGSLTQSALKAKLEARKANGEDVDVNRKLEAADLTVGDLTAGISIQFSKKFNTAFGQSATFKRVSDGKEEDTTGDTPQTPDTEGDGDMSLEQSHRKTLARSTSERRV